MVEWRVSWTMWPFAWPAPHATERITDDEESARDQFAGLLSMLAPHDLRPCDDHIWEPRLERREKITTEWARVTE